MKKINIFLPCGRIELGLMFQNKHLWHPVLCIVYFDSVTFNLFFLPPRSWSGMPPPLSFFEFSPNDTHSQHSTSHRLKWFCMSPTGIAQHISHYRLATKYIISILFSTRNSMHEIIFWELIICQVSVYVTVVYSVLCRSHDCNPHCFLRLVRNQGSFANIVILSRNFHGAARAD